MSKAPFNPAAASEMLDLRTGTSLWASSAPRFPEKHPRRSGRVDVVIIGAGITGALLAHTLAKRGLSLIMLDRREPADGSTMASTAPAMGDRHATGEACRPYRLRAGEPSMAALLQRRGCAWPVGLRPRRLLIGVHEFQDLIDAQAAARRHS
jgi:glycine/D-amino acid oxidase-like deaminating enzyme